VKSKIQWLEGEMDPSAAQANSAVAWTLEQVVAKQFLNILQDARLTGRVKPVASKVDWDARQLEAPRVATDGVTLFEDGGTGFALIG
jgi:hypothetical protein